MSTFEKVRDILAEQFEIDPSEITLYTNIIDDIGADSLDIVELIMAVEDNYGISINDEDDKAHHNGDLLRTGSLRHAQHHAGRQQGLRQHQKA